MASIFRPSTFNNFKSLFHRRYSKANFNPRFQWRHRPLPRQDLSETSIELEDSIENQTHVSTTLATHLLSNEFPNSNVVFSPLSIHVVLSILAAGCKGPTQDQLLRFLKADTAGELNTLYSRLVSLIFADGSPNGGPRLSVANGLWVEKTLTLKPSFKQVVDKAYKAACNQVDFQMADAVANEVNLWAEKRTNGLIQHVLDASALNSFTRLIFANAVYFKGAWSQKFYPEETKISDFHLVNGSKVRVPFMTNTEKQFVVQYDDFKVLGLPYLQGRDKREFTMYIFLPHAKDGLQSLVKRISSTSDFIDRHIPTWEVDVRKFKIPKFKISIGFEASDMLKELGLILPFMSYVNDFTEMVESRVRHEPIYVSSIHQKSFVEVNEEGTEAAAVTVVSMAHTSASRFVKKDYVDFVADHPFLFVIREDVTGVVLFMGQVTDPSVGVENI